MKSNEHTIWTVEMATGIFQSVSYEEARDWNRANPGSTLDRADNHH